MAKKQEHPQKKEDAEEEIPQVVEEVKEEAEVISVEELARAESEIAPPKQTTKLDAWQPKTELGKKVKNKEITDIDEILDKGLRILEPEIVDLLLPTLETDLLLVGQAKGKFGGGQRRVFRQTQKKTREGNKPKFSTIAIVGDKNGHIGIGLGKSKETVPAREKAFRNAKLNIIKIRRGNGSWEDTSDDPHTIPFAVNGKCGSVRMRLMPAPKGTGLCVEKECQKIMGLAGLKNIRSKTHGQTSTKMNMILACKEALKELMRTKLQPQHYKVLRVYEGSTKVE